ncbi:MAG TPA: VWA domain-containing protein [Chondromyces sp.]|nr:VWA domain-containing protein [Chondromyces sp.]
MPRRASAVWLVPLLALLPLLSAVGAQEAEQESSIRPVGGLTFVDEYELTIANLVVYVTDKKGVAVTDLTQDDFQVYQDGEPKQITNFKLYTADLIRSQMETGPQTMLPPAEPSPESAPEAEAGPVPIHFVLYIDNQNLNPLDRNRVLSQAREFVRTNLHPPAQMMVVAYQRSFEVLQEFTSDPEKVLAAMRSVRRYTGGRSERERAAMDIIDRIKQLENQGRSSGRSSGLDGAGAESHEAFTLIDNYAKETTNDLMFTLDSLRQMLTSLSGLPGKKGIVYISNGLPMVPGMELYHELNRVTQDSTFLTRMYDYDQSRLYLQLAAAANAQDVAFYTIDATGLSMGGLASAEFQTARDPSSASFAHHNLIDSLRLLADETGGIAIVNSNDIAPRMELIAQDMYTYYSIGYPLQISGRDKVHKVKVELRDDPAFKDYELRYRTRFVEKSLETRVQNTVVSSLVFEVDDNPMQLDVEVGTPSAASEKRWLVPTNISFPIRKVALLPEGEDYVGRVVLFIAARDTDGKQSDLVRQEHEIRVPAADYEEAQRSRRHIDASLLMESGRYKISVALLDPLTRQDSFKTITAAVNPD